MSITTTNFYISDIPREQAICTHCNCTINHDIKIGNHFKKEPSVAGIFIAFYLLSILLILIGNVAVVLLVCCKKTLRSTTNLYLVSLCISDIAVGMFAITDDIMAHYNENFMTSLSCKGLEYIVHVALCSNIYSVLCIALDRFRAVVFPFASKHAKKQCIISISVVWIMSFLYSIRAIFWFDMVSEEYFHLGEWYTYQQCAIPITAEKLLNDFVIVDFLVVYIIPLIIINILHALIIRKIRNDKIKVAPHNKERRQRQNRIVKMLFVIVVLFGICQLPEHIYRIYRYRKGIFNNFLIIHEICDLITFCNSWLNVVVYVILNDNFAKHLKRLLHLNKHESLSGQSEYNQDKATMPPRSNITKHGTTGASVISGLKMSGTLSTNRTDKRVFKVNGDSLFIITK